ncbi:MAG TPA: hypothetical protein VJN70_02945 [Gemmatimonadaceae bacterium]|nr:hypothetical protein [Gemmatimonadaceae bacterium]
MFDGRSPAGQAALAQLRAAFQLAGFYAEKERWTEYSLRVYPERRGRYPLLNPRLVGAKSRWVVAVREPSVVCPVYSDHDDSITRVLHRLPRIAGCRFIASPPRRRSTRYELHGTFVLPIVVPEPGLVDFDSLQRPLASLHLHLTAGLFLGGAAAGALPSELRS